MKVYNSLTRQKEEFVPLDGKKVKMYACGITPSGEAHIGHLYQALIYDILRNFLKKEGFIVTYARNYTCLLYTSPSPRDRQKSRMPSSA